MNRVDLLTIVMDKSTKQRSEIRKFFQEATFWLEHDFKDESIRKSLKISSFEDGKNKNILFTYNIREAVRISSFLLRDYFNYFFKFTFPDSFKQDVKLLGTHWIETRDNIFVKVIDVTAIVCEAFDFCNKSSSQLKQVCEWFTNWFEEYLAEDFFKNGGWSQLNKISYMLYGKLVGKLALSLYQCITLSELKYRKCDESIVKQYNNSKNSFKTFTKAFGCCKLTLWLKNSAVFFPVLEDVFCQKCRPICNANNFRKIIYLRTEKEFIQASKANLKNMRITEVLTISDFDALISNVIPEYRVQQISNKIHGKIIKLRENKINQNIENRQYVLRKSCIEKYADVTVKINMTNGKVLCKTKANNCFISSEFSLPSEEEALMEKILQTKQISRRKLNAETKVSSLNEICDFPEISLMKHGPSIEYSNGKAKSNDKQLTLNGSNLSLSFEINKSFKTKTAYQISKLETEKLNLKKSSLSLTNCFHEKQVNGTHQATSKTKTFASSKIDDNARQNLKKNKFDNGEEQNIRYLLISEQLSNDFAGTISKELGNGSEILIKKLYLNTDLNNLEVMENYISRIKNPVSLYSENENSKKCSEEQPKTRRKLKKSHSLKFVQYELSYVVLGNES